MHIHLTSETSSDGILDRSFTLGEITGVLWSPASPTSDAPLILMGHGGGLHKRVPGLVSRAQQSVLRDGYHVASIDSPGHGERERSADDLRWVAAIGRARRAGTSTDAIIAEFNGLLAVRAVPEWQATIDALQALPDIGADVPIGYTGMTLASAIGIRLTAADSRIRAAIFGGVTAYDTLLAAARRVTAPLEFLLPWDDEEIDRAGGLAVFDAFASEDKTLHAFPGSHRRVPLERVDTRFFGRQFGTATLGGRIVA